MSVPIPIRGLLAVPFRICGITPSKMNPNICTICERAFTLVKKRKHITATASILFADLRGYTKLSEQMDPLDLSQLVSMFHDRCAQGIWAYDGIVNKQMGDGLMAIFNFPIKAERHAAAAISAGIEIQRSCALALGDLLARQHAVEGVGVGVGVHTGPVEIGEFSSFQSDFTAIGGTVNLTARLQAQAAAGEILVSEAAAAAVPEHLAGTRTRELVLKGIERPVTAHVLTVPEPPAPGT